MSGERVDVLVEEGSFRRITPHSPSRERTQEGEIKVIEAGGALIAPPFVDAHFHLDATLTLGRPRLNRSGTLLEGIQLWAEQKPSLTEEDIYERAYELIRWAVARGTLAMRTHLDTCDPQLRAVRALVALREEVRPFFDLQLVAFPQDGYLRHPKGVSLLEEALELGVDVVGGIPHFERSAQAGRESVERLCRLAAERGLRVDMHCDETDDPQSRHVETLAEQTMRFGLQGRVSASHVTSLHSAPNEFAAKLIPLLAEADVSVIANPLINITLQGRHDTYPKRRGMTRVPELLAGGVNVAFGHDCVMDPWYAMGSADLLEVAHMGLHVAQMTSLEGMQSCFEAVTLNPARALGLEPWRFEEGAPATFVLLHAQSPREALRLRAGRRLVVRQGQVLAEAPAPSVTLTLPQSEARAVDFWGKA
jgi:cytosine deaminase